MDGKAECHANRPGSHDGAQKHLYRQALRHADDHPHHHPNLDAHTEPHTATHLHCLPDSNAASHNHSNTHAYSASNLDGVPDAYAYYAECHLDPIADAYTASHAYAYLDPNAHIHANKSSDPHTLKRVTVSRML